MLVSLLALAATPRPSPAGSPGTSALTVLASIAAAVAALAVLATVWYARKTVAAAKATIQVAEVARQADERDRLRRQLERIAELLIEVRFGALRVQRAGGDEVAARMDDLDAAPAESWWLAPRDRLEVAVVGLRGRLPRCVEVLGAGTAITVLDRLEFAEPEVAEQLRQLDAEDDGAGT